MLSALALLLASGAEARARSFSCDGAASWTSGVSGTVIPMYGDLELQTDGRKWDSGDSTCRNTWGRVAYATFTWIAPSTGSGTVTFYAMCGGKNPGVYLASPLAVAESLEIPTNNPSVAPTGIPSMIPTSTPSQSPVTKCPLAAGQTAVPSMTPSTATPSVPPTGAPVVVTSSPSTASPATNVPSLQVWSVTLATSAFKADFKTRLAEDLGILASAFEIAFSPGSVVALIIFYTASNGVTPSQAASMLSGSSPQHLSTALQTTISSVWHVASTRRLNVASRTRCHNAFSSLLLTTDMLATPASCQDLYRPIPMLSLGSHCHLDIQVVNTHSFMLWPTRCSFSPDDTNFEVSWSHNNTHIKLRLQADTDGWVGLGYGTSQMTPSYADIGWCSSGVADVEEYYMTGKNTGSINRGGNELSGRTCTEINGKTTVEFVRALLGTSTISTSGDTNCIWAYGSTDSLSQHSNTQRGIIKINFGTGTGSTVDEVDYILAHSICMWLGMCFFFVIGISSVRYLKADETQIMEKPKWLLLHIGAQCFGVFFMILGFGLGYASVAGPIDKHFSDDTSQSHGKIGLVLCSASLIQIVGGLLRPQKEPRVEKSFVCILAQEHKTTMRKIWEFGHKVLLDVPLIAGPIFNASGLYCGCWERHVVFDIARFSFCAHPAKKSLSAHFIKSQVPTEKVRIEGTQEKVGRVANLAL
eukprot:jgi/Bigna1/84132/fgenesh1_pg.124_\